MQSRLKRKNQVLFSLNSELLSDLALLVGRQSHRAMVLWAFELADETVEKLSIKYPAENRLREAVELSKAWAAGQVKMPVAQRAILQAHAVAKAITSPEDIALCHAIGQACGVVHTSGHAMGFPIYDLTAIIRRYGVPACGPIVEQRKQQYIDRLLYWQGNYDATPRKWADFMLRD